MQLKTALFTLCLLRLSPLVSSVPVMLTEGATKSEIWVRKENTLNATVFPGDLTTIDGAVVQLNGDVDSDNSTDAVSGSEGQLSEDVSSNTPSIPDTYPIQTNRRILSALRYLSPMNNATTISSNGTYGVEAVAGAADGKLQLKFVNKWHTDNLKITISGLDPKGALIMLGQNGQWIYPTTSSATPQPVNANIAIPLGKNQTLPITLPGFISSSRIWISEGPMKFYVVATPNGPGLVEPAAVNPNDSNSQINYGFGEISWGKDYGLYADITAVDFVGLPLGIELVDAADKKQTVLGTPANAAMALCEQLKAQKKVDGRAWDQLCAYKANGELVRVLAPALLQSQTPNAFGTYFSKYVDDVWSYYRTHDLIINTQTDTGNVTCRTSGNTLNCAGDNRGYVKPNNLDIFGCNTGPFAIKSGDNGVHLAVVPRLCAAFNRASLLIPGGNVQPGLSPKKYYIADNTRALNSRPMNHYSRLVHAMEVDQRGYAFSYDDVSASNEEDQSGLVFSPTPKLLTFIVGGSG